LNLIQVCLNVDYSFEFLRSDEQTATR